MDPVKVSRVPQSDDTRGERKEEEMFLSADIFMPAHGFNGIQVWHEGISRRKPARIVIATSMSA